MEKVETSAIAKGEAAMPMAARRTVKSAKSFRMFGISRDRLHTALFPTHLINWEHALGKFRGTLILADVERQQKETVSHNLRSEGMHGACPGCDGSLGIRSAETANDCRSEVLQVIDRSSSFISTPPSADQ